MESIKKIGSGEQKTDREGENSTENALATSPIDPSNQSQSHHYQKIFNKSGNFGRNRNIDRITNNRRVDVALKEIRDNNARVQGLKVSAFDQSTQSEKSNSSVTENKYGSDSKGHHKSLDSQVSSSQEIKYTAGDKLDQKAFTGNLKQVWNLALKINRKDVLDNLLRLAKEQGISLEVAYPVAEDALKEIRESLSTSDTTDDLLTWHPLPPNTFFDIHEQSLKTFTKLEAKSGHTFTGLIHIQPNGKYKMFLAAIQPSEGTDADPSKAMKADPMKRYLGLLHDLSQPDTIYGQEVPPLYHLKAMDKIPPREGHAQLGDYIKKKQKFKNGIIEKKYEHEKFEDGNFIGFTVIKGRISDGLSNKYFFVSQRSNPYTFKKVGGELGDGRVPKNWQRVIKRILNAISLAEYVDKEGNM